MAATDLQCPICFQPLAGVSEHNCALICGHVYHTFCLEPLRQASPPGQRIRCPVCRVQPEGSACAQLVCNRARVVVAFAEEPGRVGFVLLVRDWQNRWCLPGGRLEEIDSDESPLEPLQATAARELQEETGLQLPRDLYGNVQLEFLAAEGRQAYYTYLASTFDWPQLHACFQSRSDFREIRNIWVGPWGMAAEWDHLSPATRSMIVAAAARYDWW